MRHLQSAVLYFCVHFISQFNYGLLLRQIYRTAYCCHCFACRCDQLNEHSKYRFVYIKSVLNLQMTYIIIAHIYEQWDR